MGEVYVRKESSQAVMFIICYKLFSVNEKTLCSLQSAVLYSGKIRR